MYRFQYFPSLLFFAWLTSVATLVTAQPREEFVRISDYLSQHPAQLGKMERFSALVRGEAIPMNKLVEPVRIAVIYPAEQASDYWRRSVTTLEKRLRELKVPYDLKGYYSRPSVDIALQSQQLRDALNWNPDYLIFTLDATRHQAMIERILLRGSPKLILQNITTPLKEWQQLRPFLYTGFDHEQGTLVLAEAIKEKLSAGNYAMLYFTPGYVSKMRGNTFVGFAEAHTHLSRYKSFYTQGDKQLAYNASQKLLESDTPINMIFACSTDIALGAAQALTEAGKHEQVLLNGWGGGDAEIEALQKGELDLTVMRMNDDSSVAIAEAIKLDQQGKTGVVPHIYSGDIILIDQQTTAAELNILKQRAFRYSGLKGDSR